MSTGSVLLIDDEEKLRALLKRIISLEGYTVFEASGTRAALKILDKESVNIVLCDVKLPDGNGVEFIRTLKEKFPAVEVILLTAYGNIPDGVQAVKNGAFDYITKGDDNDKIIPLLSRAMEKIRLQKKIEHLQKQVRQDFGLESILGDSPLIRDAISLATKVAPTDTTVMLLGETGTGKEVFAQAIHHASKRAGNLFLALNCSSFSKELLESELFGHRAGSFTSAVREKK